MNFDDPLGFLLVKFFQIMIESLNGHPLDLPKIPDYCADVEPVEIKSHMTAHCGLCREVKLLEWISKAALQSALTECTIP
jgi:hypothetical protein